MGLSFCPPHTAPHDGAGDTGLCLLNHTVLCLLIPGPLGANAVGLRTPTLEVKYHSRVVRFFPGSLHCAVFHLWLPRVHGLFPKGPRLQLQIRIVGFPLLTGGPQLLWILARFEPSANHPPGQQRAASQQKQQKCQQGEENLEPRALARQELLLAACTAGGSHGGPGPGGGRGRRGRNFSCGC